MLPALDAATGESIAPARLAPVTVAPDPKAQLSAEVHTAARSAVQLGLSLVGTWSVALVMRLLLPRYLGPDRFGMYTFSDSFAALALGFLSFGLNSYIQKEIPLRPSHASDFFGGALVLRSLLALLVLGGLQLVLTLTGRPALVHRLVLVFGLGYLVVNMNAALAALLQANSTVGGLAAANVVSKVLWGALVGLGMIWKTPLEALAGALIVAELLRSVVLYNSARRRLGLTLRVDIKASVAVIVASLPYYANSLAVTLSAQMDITLLSFLSRNDEEVGWYGAASNVAGLVFLLAPLMQSVLLPLLSRVNAQSSEAFWRILQRAAEAFILAGSPVVLVLTLGAPTWIGILFKPAFLPAAYSLCALAPNFVLTYLAVLYSMALVVKGRGWALTSITVVGLLVQPPLTVLLVPATTRLLGPGGAGVGAGLAILVSELVVTVLLIWRLGRSAVTARLAIVAGGTLVGSCGALAAHWLLGRLGPARLAADLAVYFAIVIGVGAMRPKELSALGRELWAGRRTAQGR